MGRKHHWLPLLLAAGLVAGSFLSGCAREPSLLQRPKNEPQIKAFFDAKEAQARQLASRENRELPPEIWPFFQAGRKGDWVTMTNLYWAMAKRCFQFPDNVINDPRMETRAWHPINETFRFYLQCTQPDSKYALKYGEEILKSVPPGSIYFGDNDASRFVMTALCRSHKNGDPVFVLTQNALSSFVYRDYLDDMFGKQISIPTNDDFARAYQSYMTDALVRAKQGKLRWDEKVIQVGDDSRVTGEASIVGVNSQISRTMFYRNHNHEFHLSMAYPADWMFPHLEPHGPVLKICREQQDHLSDEIIKQDHSYWAAMTKTLIGDWLNETTTMTQLCDFIDTVYIQKTPKPQQGDPAFTQSVLHWQKDPQYFSAGQAWSGARSAIARVYYWRLGQAKTLKEQQVHLAELDLALRQSIALHPCSYEGVFMYVHLLNQLNRRDEARQLLKTLQKIMPERFLALEKELLK